MICKMWPTTLFLNDGLTLLRTSIISAHHNSPAGRSSPYKDRTGGCRP
ncbi:hypothetical protein CGRA01v4_08088 [Colletotrichum graminicola]|nr:hypothetical protein CGRA01v4_08088 [Colletotrichum graminicola]